MGGGGEWSRVLPQSLCGERDEDGFEQTGGLKNAGGEVKNRKEHVFSRAVKEERGRGGSVRGPSLPNNPPPPTHTPLSFSTTKTEVHHFLAQREHDHQPHLFSSPLLLRPYLGVADPFMYRLLTSRMKAGPDRCTQLLCVRFDVARKGVRKRRSAKQHL